MKVPLLWSFCVILATRAEPPIPTFGATSFLPLITLNQPEIFPPSGSNVQFPNSLIYQQFGNSNAGSNPGQSGFQQQQTSPSPSFVGNNGNTVGLNAQQQQQLQPQQQQQFQQQRQQQQLQQQPLQQQQPFNDSPQEDAPSSSNDTPSNDAVETANESLQSQSTNNNANQQQVSTTRFASNQAGFAQGVQQQRPQYFGPTSNGIDNGQQNQGATPQYFGPQQPNPFPSPQTGFAQQQGGVVPRQPQGFSPGFAPQVQPGFAPQQAQQNPNFPQGFRAQQQQQQPSLGIQPQANVGQGFPQQPQGFATQQEGVVSSQTPTQNDAQTQNDGPDIQNQGLVQQPQQSLPFGQGLSRNNPSAPAVQQPSNGLGGQSPAGQAVLQGQQNPQAGLFQPQTPNPGQIQGPNPGLTGRTPQRVVPNPGVNSQLPITPRGNQGNVAAQTPIPNDNVVKGQYRVGLPDGRTQIVRYIALVTYSNDGAYGSPRTVGAASNKRGILASLDGQTIEDDSGESSTFSQKRKRSDFQEVSVPLKSPFGLRLAKIIKRRLKMAEKEKRKEIKS